MKNQSNVTLASVAEAFSQLSTSGTEQILTGGSNYTEGESHIQGIAQYGNYYLITQNRYEHDEGKLYFFNATNGQYVNAIHLPVNSGTQNDDDHQYNHPGGIDVLRWRNLI